MKIYPVVWACEDSVLGPILVLLWGHRAQSYFISRTAKGFMTFKGSNLGLHGHMSFTSAL